MHLNKNAFFTIFTVLILSGCVNPQTEEQKTTISNLESELALAQTTNRQTQDELAVSTEKVATLSAQLSEEPEMPKPVPVVTEAKNNKFDNKSVLGQAEWIYVSAVKSNFKARIDSGAATSSINALDIERFERDGKKWVRFNLTHSTKDKKEVIEAKIVRIAKITQSSNPGKETERLVVSLHVRIGDVAQATEFTLTDRVHMEYPVLIGRTFMQDVVIVDVSKEYIYPKYQAKK
jgi:hypothetical protein